MKKKKKVWVLVSLFVFLAALVGIYMGLKKPENPEDNVEDENEDDDSARILNWNGEKTQKISLFDNMGEKITLFKEKDTWKLAGNEKISLIEDEVKRVIGFASEVEVERILENVEDLSEFGLDEPVNVIERETEDGEVESFAIGTYNKSTGFTYIYLNDKKDVVYAVNKNLGNLYKCDLLDLVEYEAYPTLMSDNVRKVEVVRKENSFTMLYDLSATTGWMVEDAVYGRKMADDYEGENLASMISLLSYSEFYEYDCQDFSVYGLDEPQMEIRVTYEETVEVESSETGDSDTENVKETQKVTRNFVLSVGNLNEDGYYYVRMNDSKEVHGIAQTHIDKLLGENAVDYWALNMGEIALDKLDYMEVKYEGSDYTLKRVVTETAVENTEESTDSSEDKEDEPEVKKIIAYYVNDVVADSDTFETFYRNAIGIKCQERMVSCETEAEPELVLKFHGVDGKEVIVSYIPWDGSFYAAINNGTDFGLVNKMSIKNLIELFQKVVK